MIRIFTVIEDAHTVYIAPQPLRSSLALIPFSVREFYDEGGNRKFIVTDVAIGAKFSNPLFKKGVEIVKWNGLPIQEAVRRLGTDSFGNNPDSKLMFGIRKLTARDLAIEELPRTRNVTFDFLADDGIPKSVSVPWIYSRLSPAVMAMMGTRGARFTDTIGNVSMPELFENVNLSKSVPPATATNGSNLPVNVLVKNDISGKLASTKSGKFGIITLFGFSGRRATAIAREFARLLLFTVPKDGVVIDVRQNPGGLLLLCQGIVPFFSNKTVFPITLSFRATRFLLEAARGVFGKTFVISDDDVTRTKQFGNLFFNRFLFFLEQINAYSGPRYPGPVIVLTDAETYSCGDMFASTVKDNAAGLLVGMHNTTGGGGSTVRTASSLRNFFPIPLLRGVEMTTSFSELTEPELNLECQSNILVLNRILFTNRRKKTVSKRIETCTSSSGTVWHSSADSEKFKKSCCKPDSPFLKNREN